ncbi:MAG: hypothetical protein JO354_05165 [Verrucomicrobia bacterium]|nr:hypothetical protein [Verrucomicrobiota bacterium]
MLILFVLTVVVGAAVDYTTSIRRNAARSATYQTAVAVGDGALDILFYNWRNTCRSSGVPTTNTFSAVPTPTPFLLPTPTPPGGFVKRGTGYDPNSDSDYDPRFTISNYKIIAVDPEYNALANTSSTPKPQLGQISQTVSSVPASSNISVTYNYIASADVTLSAVGPQEVSTGQRAGGNVVAHVRRVFQKQQLSPWNWAIFYADDLEIHPGPKFTISGWVHTNANLYTAHNTLTFSDKVTYSGTWNRNGAFMPGDGSHTGETPQSPNYPSNLPPTQIAAQQPFGIDTSIFNPNDNNPNNDSYHELIDPPITPSNNPNSQYYDPLIDGSGNPIRYYDQAGSGPNDPGIIIQVSDNPSLTTPGWDGVRGHDIVKLYTPNVNQSTGAVTLTSVTSGPLYSLFATPGAITTNQSIQDNREQATVRVASLDVSKIVTGSGANPNYGIPNGAQYGQWNGSGNGPVIYMYDTSATSSARRGIRVVNGSRIPTSGLTVASPNPVYIQGDFNTGGTGSVVPSNNPANLNPDGTYQNPSNPPNPQVSGYTRAPSSVIADAVNILSNSWLDINSGTMPVASPTTVNTAIISGNVVTNANGDSAYSGGAENFPRFLENWSNKTFSYYGSMVELYQSQQATGEWGKANVYSPPARQWFFDNNFKTNPPPGSVMIYNYIKARWSVF